MNFYTQRRHDRVEDHICTQCGKRDAIEGMRLCDPCNEIRLERIKWVKDMRSSLGLCKIHGRPTVEGKKGCLDCLISWALRRKNGQCKKKKP